MSAIDLPADDREGGDMHKRLVLVSILSIGSLLAVATPAMAVGTIDQEQLNTYGESSASNMRFFGQTFTAGMTGVLDSVALYPSAGHPMSGDLLEIRTVSRTLPTKHVLASQTITSTVSGDWVTTTFAAPTSVVAGTRYAITVTPPTVTAVNLRCSGWGSNPYPGGTAVISREKLKFDLAFITYVTPANYQPDGWISKGSQPYVGNDVYNTDGTGQARVATPQIGVLSLFRVAVQNDGNVPDRFTVQALGGAPYYSIRYYRHDREINDAVVNGTFATPVIAPGDVYVIRVRVKLTSFAGEPRASRLVTLTSVNDPTKVDAVQFVVRPR